MTYHFVEVMACPSGCLNGGGQMKDEGARVIDRKEIVAQLEQLYHHGEVVLRDPRGNPNLGQVEAWLGGFTSQKATEVLHTTFHDRTQKTETASTAMMIDF